MDIDKHLKKESKKFKLDRTKSVEQQARLKKKITIRSLQRSYRSLKRSLIKMFFGGNYFYYIM